MSAIEIALWVGLVLVMALGVAAFVFTGWLDRGGRHRDGL